MKDILGEKGANLSEMWKLDIPMTPGFIITCPVCLILRNNPDFIDEIFDEVKDYIGKIEKISGKKFGDPSEPLLLAVRSGAPVSMPGMMDTILNVGINDEIVEALSRKRGERFAWDTYRTFIQFYLNSVVGIDPDDLEDIYAEISDKLAPRGSDLDLGPEDFKYLAEAFKAFYSEYTGERFPSDPYIQLKESIKGVFASWDNPHVRFYRKVNGIPDTGTAVIVQMMVFGNINTNSATGIAFSRDPSTGRKVLMGEYLKMAQGEARIIGYRSPIKLSGLRKEMPEIYVKLGEIAKKLEAHFRDMQNLEFTIEDGTLYIMQTRNAPRSPRAAVKVAIDLMREKLIDKKEVIMRIDPEILTGILFKRVNEKKNPILFARGNNVSPGAVTGHIVLTAENAERWANNGKKVILVKERIKPDDIYGVIVSSGIITRRGGKTSHAAVIARNQGIPAVSGVKSLKIYPDSGVIECKGIALKEGDIITIDGSSGAIYLGAVDMVEPSVGKEFDILMKITDEFRNLKIRANADTPKEVEQAIKFGCEGIGLCRTEHMFEAPERLPIVRDIFFARSSEEREKTLMKIKPMQKEDFREIFKIMKGKPVTIRLFDPPLHDFLPDEKSLAIEIAVLEYRKKMGEDVDRKLNTLKKLYSVVERLSEANPMLGLRGCRIGVLWPSIFKVQLEAIFEAACEIAETGINVKPEILVPFVSHPKEIVEIRTMVEEVTRRIFAEYGIEIDYKFGTMIEIPRAALCADEIAEYSDFFSFGTNDLTQMVLSLSRTDAEEKILPKYIEKKIYEKDPFVTLDIKGTGKLIELAISNGKKIKPKLEMGVTGVHAKDPDSIVYFDKIGLDYISCPPFMLPSIRLAAARAAIINGDTNTER